MNSNFAISKKKKMFPITVKKSFEPFVLRKKNNNKKKKNKNKKKKPKQNKTKKQKTKNKKHHTGFALFKSIFLRNRNLSNTK